MLNFFSRNSSAVAAITELLTVAFIAVAGAWAVFVWRQQRKENGRSQAVQQARGLPISTYWPTRQPYFTGRKKSLAQLKLMLARGNHILLEGVGGIGKSTLTRQYIATYTANYRHIIFINYDDSLQDSIVNGVSYPYRGLSNAVSQKYVEIIEALSAVPNTTRCLFVLDNFDPQGDRLDAELKELKDLLARLGKWNCLIISRMHITSFNGVSLRPVYLSGLKHTSAKLLFLKYWIAGDGDREAINSLRNLPEQMRSKITNLLENIDHHPLTLEIMSKTLRKEGAGVIDKLLDFSSDTKIKVAYRENNELAMSTLLGRVFSLSHMSRYSVRLIQIIVTIYGSQRLEQAWLESFCQTMEPKKYDADFKDSLEYLVDRGWIVQETVSAKEEAPYSYISCHAIVRQFVLHDSPSISKYQEQIAATLLLYINDPNIPFRQRQVWLVCAQTLLNNKGDGYKSLATACHKLSDDIGKWQEYWQRAVHFGDNGDDEQQIKYLDLVTELDPVDSRAFVIRADAKRHSGDNSGAIDDYSQAIKLNPLDASSLACRAISYANSGNFGLASNDINAAQKIDTNLAVYHIAKGWLQFCQDDNEGLLQEYDKAGNLDPSWRTNKSGDYYCIYGEALAKQGDHLLAIGAFSSAIKCHTHYRNRSHLYYLRAESYRAERYYQKALDDCNKALELRTDYANAYWLRGHIRLDMGRSSDDWIPDLRKGNELDPLLSCGHYPEKK